MSGKKIWGFGLILLAVAIAQPVLAFGGNRPRPVVVRHYRISVNSGYRFGPRFFALRTHFRGRAGVRSDFSRNGRVDFNVEPQESEIYIDGAYLGIADDFNGGFFGTTAVLPAGPHTVRIVSPGGRIETKKIYVAPGQEIDFDLKF